ncbi:RNA-directed DNA polymerase, eukaryota, reverse transcriptase zinc-binding domain protein [Tanacetum coccineum]|uniref:RNA-directed DNA polymerase, eukaryota, reverse transcriptase zinc-binding domain protein n=1 Tax=Tanacetum coccineum TaxID=301880 RepID=A0ABQ4Y5X3_9ASTR
MGGRKFTRMNRQGIKLSKIDRFLVTHHFLSKWLNDILTSLDRDLSDHCPLVLKTYSVDYGPTPFKFFNSWLLSGDFSSIVALAWHNYNNPTVPQVSHPTIFLKNKLQSMKKHIRFWRDNMKCNNEVMLKSLKEKVVAMELKGEVSGLADVEIVQRLDQLKQIEGLEHIKRLDLMQKAKVKWDIEGDENSKKFHDYWDTFGEDFINMVLKFEVDSFIPKGFNSSFIALVPKIQDPLYIKDFRPISLIGCQYKVIYKLLANHLSQVVNSVVSEVQTAYIKERKIIDGPLMVNEILAWASKKKETLFILKVDFEKTFDSLDWKLLDHTVEQMDFSQKWRSWIRGCLNSAYRSVLVNGSPTQEFKIQKGLRQGDPLSPFLFILAIEALHVSLQEAKSKNLFEGVKILRCFHMASGLKVNFSKIKFYGIGVSNEDTHLFASTIHCQPSSLPCTYLGLPIGANLNKSNSWKPIVDKFHKTLSNWKAKNLSYGGRLTLMKSVLGALDMRKYIECKILATTEEETRWNKMLPIKVNINTWRLCLDRLPTRCNLDARGVDLDSTRCPICDEDLESSQHLFLECLVASSLWQMVTTWCISHREIK